MLVTFIIATERELFDAAQTENACCLATANNSNSRVYIYWFPCSGFIFLSFCVVIRSFNSLLVLPYSYARNTLAEDKPSFILKT
jgi:hypothetical protein